MLENKQPQETTRKKIIRLNKKIINITLATFILSSIALLGIDYFKSELSTKTFNIKELWVEQYGKKGYGLEEFTLCKVYIKTPFGANFSPEKSYYRTRLPQKYFRDKNKIKTLNEVMPENLFRCYIKDFWVVLIVTTLITLLTYIHSKIKFRID